MAKLFNRQGICLHGKGSTGVSVSGTRQRRVYDAWHRETGGSSPEDLSRLLGELRSENPAARGRCRVILPPETCENFLYFNAGVTTRKELSSAEVTRWLEEEHMVETGDYDIHFCPFNSDAAKAAVVSLTERGLIDSYQSRLRAAGLRNVVFLSPLDALLRSVPLTKSDPLITKKAFLHAGLSLSMFLIVENGAPVFFRIIQQTIELQDAGSSRYEQLKPGGLMPKTPSPASIASLAGEIKRTLQFQHLKPGDPGVDEIHLSAEGIELHTLQPVLEEVADMTALLASPDSEHVDVGPLREEGGYQGEWSQLMLPIAVAAPMRVTPAMRLATVPGIATAAFTFRRMAASFIILLAVLMAAWWLALGGRVGELTERKSVLERNLSELERDFQQIRDSYAKREEMRGVVGMLHRMKWQGAQSAELFAAINNARPAAIRFRNLRLESKNAKYGLTLKGRVELSDTIDALHAVEEYVRNLRDTGLFDSVYIEESFVEGGPERGSGTEGIQAPEQKNQDDGRNDFTFALKAEAPARWSYGETQ